MNEIERCFEPVSDAELSMAEDIGAEPRVTFTVGEVMKIKGHSMKIVRITKHCLVLRPLGWEPDIGEDIRSIKSREKRRERK